MSDPQASQDFALEVVLRLRRAGFQAYWAGGCVRDLLVGLIPADYDVATDATPEQVMMTLPFRALTVGITFGVVRVRHPRLSGVEVEVATFRSDMAYVDGRRPTSVVFSTPELDASRRDFTINGMFMDPTTREVVDHVGGLADLQHQVLRAIGDPEARFREDKLRLLRAVRFAARFGLAIEPNTRSALRTMAGQVAVVSPERIAQELRRMLLHSTRALAMAMAMDAGLIAAILPPLTDAKGLFQGKPIQPEGDLWDHVILVLRLLEKPSFNLAFAALLHDVGKPYTRSNSQGRASFHNHDQVGSRIADGLCRSLRLSNAERERITWLVAYHQYLGEAKRLREAKLKRVLAEPGIEELLALHRADALASTGEAENVDYCWYYLKNQPAGPINPPPLLTGHDLVRHGLTPGADFAEILERIREGQLERRLSSKRDAFEWVDQYRSTGSWPEAEEVDAEAEADASQG
jgi:poly(A) polymerase